MRMFGHIDPVGPDHAGPEARWHKQQRRALRKRIRKSETQRANAPEELKPVLTQQIDAMYNALDVLSTH